MMKISKKSIIVVVCLLMAVCPSVYGDVSAGDVFQLWSHELFGGNVGNPFTNWYEVAEWETKVCFDWGGDKDPNQVFGDTMQGDIFHDTVITIQAESRNPLPEESADHVGEMLYEVAWFVQPTQIDEDMSFEVYLYSDSGQRKLLESGSSNYVNSFRGYHSEYTEVNYTKASIHYWNDRTDDEREVPVV